MDLEFCKTQQRVSSGVKSLIDQGSSSPPLAGVLSDIVQNQRPDLVAA